MLRVAEEFHRTDPGRQRRGNEDALYSRAPLFVEQVMTQLADLSGAAEDCLAAAKLKLAEELPAAAGVPHDMLMTPRVMTAAIAPATTGAHTA